MRISTVTARNFTGCNFDVTLGPVSIITGDNFAGKTAIPNVIRLALSGSLPPPIGVKGIYRLAGNPEAPGTMSVGLAMDNGRTVQLQWTRDAKGKVAATGGIPSDLVMPPMLVNPASFWAKTGAERVKAIFDSCPGAGKELAQAILDRFAAGGIALIPLRDELQTLVADAFQDRVTTPQEAASRLLAVLKEQASDAMVQVKSLAQMVQRTGTRPPDVSKELDKAREELSQVKVTTATSAARLGEIKAELEAYSRKYQQTPVEHLLEFLKAEYATVEKDARNLKPAPPLDDVQEELEIAQADEQIAQASANDLAAALRRLETQIADLTIKDKCPVCMNAVKGWKNAALKSLNTALEEGRALCGNALASLNAAKATADRLRETVASIKKAAHEHQQRKEELYQETLTLQADYNTVTGLLAEREKLAATTETAPQQTSVDFLRARVAELEQQHAARLAFDAETERMDRQAETYQKATVRAEGMKAAAAIVLEEQSKAAEAVFNTVLKTARYFTDGILNSPLEFIDGDLGRRVSVIDRARPGFVATLGSWITHETFSDSEKRIAYVGFSVAMAAEAPVKLVVVDEMATMTVSRKVQFVDRLIQLVRKGIIDQAICIEPEGQSYVPFSSEPDVRLIQL